MGEKPDFRKNFVNFAIPNTLSMRIFFAILFTILYAGAQALSADNQQLLKQLDQELQQLPAYEAKKENKIQQLKTQAAQASSLEEKFWVYRNLIDEYSVFDSDSALSYGEEALRVANALERGDFLNDINLLNAYTLAATGLLEQSRRAVEAVDTTKLDDLTRCRYYDQMVYQLTHEDQYKHVDSNTLTQMTTVKQLLDDLVRMAGKDNPDYYYFVGYRALANNNHIAEAIDAIEPTMGGRRYDNRADARLAWVLAQLYNAAGDQDSRVKYLILSALSDARTSNRDIASLEELATILRQEGDLDHSYMYIDQALRAAELLKNRVRVLQVATLQTEISRLYQEKVAQMHSQRTWLMVAMGVLIIILLIALMYIYSQRGKLHDSNASLAKVNDELKSKIQELSNAYSQLAVKNEKLLDVTEELRDTNDRLAESDLLKVRCIGAIFSICSTYINKIDDFRKMISRKLKAKQYDDARQTVESPEMAQNELKDFYEQFDSVFLSMYPNFVDDFNELLPEDEKITLRSDGQLNTELRIYALVRLGITDSTKIAAVLHCAPQTVYNKRQRLRSLAGLSREEMLARIRTLGHLSGNE